MKTDGHAGRPQKSDGTILGDSDCQRHVRAAFTRRKKDTWTQFCFAKVCMFSTSQAKRHKALEIRPEDLSRLS